jgi:hypothetical protein
MRPIDDRQAGQGIEITALIEEWRVIEGYDGMYEISTFGQVLSHGRNRTRPLKLNHKKNGTVAVSLQINNVKTTFTVARLVAQYFIGEIPGDYWVFHLDGDRTNNRVDNLGILPPVSCIKMMLQEGRHWSTTEESHRHLALLPRLKGEDHPMAKFTRDTVMRIRQASGMCKDIAVEFGVSRSHVSGIRRGLFWKM